MSSSSIEVMSGERMSEESANIVGFKQEEATTTYVSQKELSQSNNSQHNSTPIVGDASYSKETVSCEHCHEIFGDSDELSNHMSIHLENPGYSCAYCAHDSNSIFELQDHMQEHGPERRFECCICHQNFSRRDSVRVHLRLHDKSKCLYCTVCDKPFLTTGALGMHMRIHRGQKPFECHICGNSFTQKTHLVAHFRVHQKKQKPPISKPMGPRKFQCDYCARTFVRLSDYERHAQWVHNINPSHSVASARPVPNIFKRPVPSHTQQKVLCNAGTQTDDTEGHVIIPRKYQQDSIFPPQTPRHDEDQFDMFDEGMDRNASSDEEDAPTMTYRAEMPSTGTSTPKDDEFDAVVKGKSVKSVPSNIPFFPTTEVTSTVEVLTSQSSGETNERVIPTEEELQEVEKEVLLDLDEEPSYSRNSPIPVQKPKALSNFINVSNWNSKSSKVRNAKSKALKPTAVLGLTGPTHLRLIRKSLQKYISDKSKPEEEIPQQEKKPATVPKRTLKSKKHGKDFVCTSKSCEVCQPSASPIKEPSPEPVKPPPVPEKKICESDDKNEKILQFILSGDAASLQGTEFQIDDDEDEKPEVMQRELLLPTYSCQLCGMEFRFEGKLHMHLKVAHQTKIAESVKRPGSPIQRAVKKINPEVLALQSEWDDEEGEGTNKPSPVEEKVQPEVRLTLDKIRSRFRYLDRSAPTPRMTAPVASSSAPTPPAPVSQPAKAVVEPSLETKCKNLLEKLFDMNILLKCGFDDKHVSVVLGNVLQFFGVKRIEDYGQGQYEVLKYNLWRLIEWKVTMEQMEEFYSAGKSVEEMMDDLMHGRVPIISHEPKPKKNPEANQLVEVTDLLANEITVDGMTILTQDVSAEMLQGAQIVTVDASTGQVLSQMPANQVIYTDISEGLSLNTTTSVVSTSSSIASDYVQLPTSSVITGSPQNSQPSTPQN